MKNIILISSLLLLPVTAYGQECFRDHIGSNPIQVTRTQTQIDRAKLLLQGIIDFKTVLIGMSNSDNVGKGLTKAINRDITINKKFLFRNGALSGKTAYHWARTENPWQRLFDIKFPQWGFTKNNVNIFMVMVTVDHPELAPLENSYLYEIYLQEIMTRAEHEMPNLKLIILLTNYYGGYDVGQDKTPEPHGWYEHSTIQRIQDNWTGNAQVIGIPLWTDGIRSFNGLNLVCPTDVMSDGHHLNSVGELKFGTWLLNRFKFDPIMGSLVKR